MQLPIRDIRNANPVWWRDDLGDLTALMNSIDLDELKLPVLIQPDNLMIDGARRLEACARLGYQTIPVKYVRSWDDTAMYFARVRELEAEDPAYGSMPMRWQELDALISGPLLLLHGEVVAQHRKDRKAGLIPREQPVPMYNYDVAKLLGLDISYVRHLRWIESLVAQITEKYEREPEVGQRVRFIVEEAQRRQSGISNLMRTLRKFAAGEISFADIENYSFPPSRAQRIAALVEREATIAIAAPKPPPVRRRPEPTPIPTSKLKAIIAALTQIEFEIRDYNAVAPDLDRASATQVVDQFRPIMRRLANLRTYVQRAADPANNTNTPVSEEETS